MRWYFSFRSPYSWLTYLDLMARYPDVADALDWVPYWEPDDRSQYMLAEAGGHFPYTEMSRERHRYILQDVRRLTRSRGLPVVWPVDRDPCWEVAHLAYLVADAHGKGREYVAAIYRERWERGHDISLRSTIAAVGGEIGLDPALLADAADDEKVRRQGLDVLLAIDRDGVFGVPFFVRGYDRFWGLDRLSEVVALVRGEAGGDSEPVEASDPADLAVDSGHAGGCG
jgi:2-hydroxychromene-2-carboxylate isomerase